MTGLNAAQRFAKNERREDELKFSGVVSDSGDVKARALAEAINCGVCGQLVHPTNMTAHMLDKHPIVIDPEFHELIPPQSPEETEALETSLLTDGCRDALVVWDETNTLIDGHHRFDICSEHGITYTVNRKSFDSREDVIVWMITNQLARRNVSTYARAELALRMKSAIAAKAKANQGTRTDLLPNSAKSSNARNTREEIASIAEVSHDTISKVEKINANAPDSITRRARKGDISINRAYELTKALKNAPETIVNFVTQHEIEEPDKVVMLLKGYADKREWCEELLLTGEIRLNGKTVGVADSILEWRYIVEKRQEERRRIGSEARKFQRETPPADMPAKDERYTLLFGTMQGVLPTLPDASIDCIITDPPYPQEYLPVYGALAQEAARLLKPGGSLVVMCGQSYFPEILALMMPHIRYHWLLSYLTPGGQSAQLFQRKVNTFWKPVLWFVNGDYTGDWLGDVTRSTTNDNDKRFHAWGQSESGMADLMTRFSKAGDTILDPFLGGGTTALVALALNRKVIGVDSDLDAIATSQERIAQWLLSAK